MIKIANNLVKLANATSNFSPFTAPFVNRMTPFVNHSDDPFSPVFAPAGSNPMSMSPERLGALAKKIKAIGKANPRAMLADHISPQEMAMYANTGIGLYNQMGSNSKAWPRSLYMYGPDGPAGYAYGDGFRRPSPTLNDVYNRPYGEIKSQMISSEREHLNKTDYADYLRGLKIDANQRGPLNIGNYYPQTFDAFKKNRK
jgi:hypothetical protein